MGVVLTVAEMQRHLNRLSYKPGWALIVREGRWEGPHLVIRATLEDSVNPGQTIVVDVHSKLPPMQSTGQLEEWLAHRLGRIELHEMREWLKRDGEPIFDPHAPYAERDLA